MNKKKVKNRSLLDITHQWISNKSVLLCLPVLYPFHPQVHSISVTSLTPLHSSLFPLFHPLSLHPCFIDICLHVTMILSSFTYSPLALFLFSLFHASTFVPSSWPSQANPAAWNLLNSRQLLYSTLVWILSLILISLCPHYNLWLSLSSSFSSMAPLTKLQPPPSISNFNP